MSYFEFLSEYRIACQKLADFIVANSVEDIQTFMASSRGPWIAVRDVTNGSGVVGKGGLLTNPITLKVDVVAKDYLGTAPLSGADSFQAYPTPMEVMTAMDTLAVQVIAAAQKVLLNQAPRTLILDSTNVAVLFRQYSQILSGRTVTLNLTQSIPTC